jgi:hypothetical protein
MDQIKHVPLRLLFSGSPAGSQAIYKVTPSLSHYTYIVLKIVFETPKTVEGLAGA